ncbi:MAG: hypothetical protein IAI50_08085 [Candidatus Eremiobacteraeota bacterium]|nr:hypothetical protein [Candidatus Eremiobacteraeota bacterium]
MSDPGPFDLPCTVTAMGLYESLIVSSGCSNGPGLPVTASWLASTTGKSAPSRKMITWCKSIAEYARLLLTTSVFVLVEVCASAPVTVSGWRN